YGIQVLLDRGGRRGARRLVRRGDRERQLLPALITDSVAVVILPVGAVQQRFRVLDRVRVARYVPDVRPGGGGYELVGHGATAVRGLLQYPTALDRCRDGLPDGAIAEDDLLRPHVQEERHEVVGRHAVEDDVFQGARTLGVRVREACDPVQLP